MVATGVLLCALGCGGAGGARVAAPAPHGVPALAEAVGQGPLRARVGGGGLSADVAYDPMRGRVFVRGRDEVLVVGWVLAYGGEAEYRLEVGGEEVRFWAPALQERLGAHRSLLRWYRVPAPYTEACGVSVLQFYAPANAWLFEPYGEDFDADLAYYVVAPAGR